MPGLGRIEHLVVHRLVEGDRRDPIGGRDRAELGVALERDLDAADLAPLADDGAKRHVALADLRALLTVTLEGASCAS